jgi:hypothetical protein
MPDDVRWHEIGEHGDGDGSSKQNLQNYSGAARKKLLYASIFALGGSSESRPGTSVLPFARVSRAVAMWEQDSYLARSTLLSADRKHDAYRNKYNYKTQTGKRDKKKT